MNKHSKIAVLAALILAGNVHFAHAQREAKPRDEKRQERRDLIEKMAPEERHQYFENRFNERLKTATPEEREKMLAFRADIEKKMKDAGIEPGDPNAFQKMRDAGITFGRGGGQNGQGGGRGNRATNNAMKQMMEAAGITDFDVQDAIVAYVAEQNKARATLFQLAQAAAGALQTPVVAPINAADNGNAETADDRVATTFKAYETAAKAENQRQDEALKALDAKINYSGTPRIKAFLTLVGILNNDVLALGGPAAIFTAPQQAGTMNAGMDGQPQQGNWNRGNQDQ